MALDIKLKRSHTHSSIPSTSDLAEGEFAVNTYDGKMYMRDGSSNVVTVGNHYATDYESSTKTFYVTVASSTSAHVHHGSGSSNKYKINGVFSPYLRLIPGITYRFDQADSSNSGHPFRFYLDENKNTSYTTGVTTAGTAGSAGAYTQIVVSHSTPAVLHYQCSAHGMMGWAAFVNTHNLTAFDTGDLTEGSNLYYTQARADARVDAGFTAKDTDNLSEGSSNLYYTDARAQAVSINNVVEDTSPQLGGALDLNSQNITGTGNISTTGDITITDTDAGSSAGPDFVLYRNSSSPADGDYIGQLQFKGKHDGGGDEIYAKVTGKISDSTQGTEDGLIETAIKGNGSFTIVSRQKSNELQLLNGVGLSVAGNTTLSGTLNGHTIPGGSGTIALTSDINAGGIASVAADTTPQLGGDLDVNGNAIVSVSNGNIAITPNGSGKVILDGLSFPTSDGSNGQVITTDGGGNLAFTTVSSGSSNSGENVSWEVTQSSHGLSVGDVIYNNGTNYIKARANATGTLGIFVVSAVTDSNTFTATFSGKITLSSLTAGQYYFVSTTTAGEYVSTEPTTGYSNPILFALTTTAAVVLPYRPQDLTSGGAAGARTALDVYSTSETNAQVSAFAIALG